MSKLKICLIFGGRSPEHEVSITSACAVASAISQDLYELIPLYVRKDGSMFRIAEPSDLAALAGDFREAHHIMALRSCRATVLPEPGAGLLIFDRSDYRENIDVIFPALHGYGGEDGSVQGLARLAGLPCVGSGILGSAAGMDKIVMKSVFHACGLPQTPWISVDIQAWKYHRDSTIDSCINIGIPLFVKPANAGSSIGITKVKHPEELPGAIEKAFKYDRRLVVEKGMDARELECGVLGNDRPAASVIGEIVPHREFYDYQAKYSEPGTSLIIPADINEEIAESVQQLALSAFQAVDAAGLARVDFLLDKNDEKLYLNEINTMPGFTPISMYPALWEASGISYSALISRLIEYATERAAYELDFRLT